MNDHNGHGSPLPTVDQSSESIWGLDAVGLHERFWASRCVQVVRRGAAAPITRSAELFVLVDDPDLVMFRLARVVDALTWLRADLMFVRLQCRRERGYRELLAADEAGRFLGFQRLYNETAYVSTRVAVTPHRWVARRWQRATQAAAGWRQLRRSVSRTRRSAMSQAGEVFDRHDADARRRFVRSLVEQWRRPETTIPRARPVADDVWVDVQASGASAARFIGPVWVGAGQAIGSGEDSIAGPAALWDRAAVRDDARPPSEQIAPAAVLRRRPRRGMAREVRWVGKRAFDMLVALIGLALTLPLFPLIMLAIWIEDGRPFFFAHRRETMGGRDFPCFKFRSMRNDAERIKAQLAKANQVDGPQFFIANDPRVTRVGKLLRRTHLDELPQLLNVLAGHMSIVGPRPSPYDENQYCPPWREARLSIRPGITGLWQVMRTRRTGQDFQEWIRYDLEYVENACPWLDLWILWCTVLHLLGRRHRRPQP